MRRWFAAVPALALAACTGGSSTPPPPRSVAHPTPAPAPLRTAQPRTTLQPGQVTWLEHLSEAQSQARSSGRLILVGSTKAGCTLCEKFMHEIAPQCAGRLNQIAVAYVYDITRPENGRIDGTLRANLPGAILMPLVGFVTADLTWVHGFAGPRTAQEFMGDVETAARLHPVRTAGLRSVSGPAVAHVSFVNEFGENEWSAPADAWPKPQDALGAQPALALATTPVPPPADATVPAALAVAPPASFPAPTAEPVVEPAPSIGDAPVVARAEPADTASGWSAPPSPAITSTPAPTAEAAPSPEPVRALSTPLPAPPPPLAAPAASAIAPVPMDENAARQRLSQAFDLIRNGQYDLARDELRRVSRSLPNTSVGREADRGGVAVYNARRLAEASAGERSDLASQARRSLSGTMWETLF